MNLHDYITDRCVTTWGLSSEQCQRVITTLRTEDAYLGEKIDSVSDVKSFFDSAFLRVAVHKAIDSVAKPLRADT